MGAGLNARFRVEGRAVLVCQEFRAACAFTGPVIAQNCPTRRVRAIAALDD